MVAKRKEKGSVLKRYLDKEESQKKKARNRITVKQKIKKQGGRASV